MGPFLPYVTAGFAGGLLDFNQYDPSDKVSQSQKKTQFQTGFTAGAGFEYALVNNWSFKADYLYYNLGMFRGVEVDLDAFSTKISFSTIRAGLNYRF
jgi:opacity protein-like surface antigen